MGGFATLGCRWPCNKGCLHVTIAKHRKPSIVGTDLEDCLYLQAPRATERVRQGRTGARAWVRREDLSEYPLSSMTRKVLRAPDVGRG